MPKMRFKVKVFLESRLKIAHFIYNFGLKYIENKQKLAKLREVAKNFRFETQEILAKSLMIFENMRLNGSKKELLMKMCIQ